MGALRKQFIEDKQGNRIAVLMPIDQYNKLLDQLEDIDDIRAYDAAKAYSNPFLSLLQPKSLLQTGQINHKPLFFRFQPAFFQ